MKASRETSTNLDQFLSAIQDSSKSTVITGLRGSSRAWTCAEILSRHADKTVMFVTTTSSEGEKLKEDLSSLLGEEQLEHNRRIKMFPRHDTAPYDRFSPQTFVTAKRMDVLFRLLNTESNRQEQLALIVPSAALVPRLPARDAVQIRSVELSIGDMIERDELVRKLVVSGYVRQSAVEEPGEIAVRGGIIDLYPPHRSNPIRIDLLGDEIETLREMDPASQRSGADISTIVIPPSRELLFDRKLAIQRGDLIRKLGLDQNISEQVVDTFIDGLLRGFAPPGSEALAPLLQPSMETLFDFLPKDTLTVVIEETECVKHIAQYWEEARDNYEAAVAAKRLVSAPKDLLMSETEIKKTVGKRHKVILERLDVISNRKDRSYTVPTLSHQELSMDLRRSRHEDWALLPLANQLNRWHEQGISPTLCMRSLSSAERLQKLLLEYGQKVTLHRNLVPWKKWGVGVPEIRIARISEGFVLPSMGFSLVTEDEIFGPREKRKRTQSIRETGDLAALDKLATGDHLVHIEHGIGVYRGLVPLELSGIQGEFLRLEYDGGDRLFLPVHRLNLIQRYIGSEGKIPTLDRLGGATWEQTKQSIRKSVMRLAQDLVSLHAQRELSDGFAFSPRDRLFEEFEARFPYETTSDQSLAIEDALADMQNNKPMDRLICGDVGYGKTEVALRACFRAVMDGKQVALLVPTTILCQQHLDTFTKRFESYPVKIESVSRFRSSKDIQLVIEGLLDATVDIVIGTHRLLQKDVVFRELGLLIIDEEHRFGVTHKERLKKLRASVDVLTLTATPIPRTLQMAFTGLRDLSVINTPPPDRLAIRTQVAEFDETLIRESILREIQRGGQTFFVHNRVQSIGSIAELIKRILPEASVLIAHGQMRESELEDRMLSFVRGEADILLCTTIIESGLDMPNANTIIIDRADSMGLAQLYQLRGRVGRGGRRAYAYLLVPKKKISTTKAIKRLEAIRDLSELGSGFRLANLDLEIRGAGNLIGPEQSGNLGAVGYETYMEMLEESIEELRGEKKVVNVDTEIRLPVSARLPEGYVPDVNQRLVLYKRLASAPDDETLSNLRDELLDRYGSLPKEAENLLRIVKLKLLANSVGISSIDFDADHLVLTCDDRTLIDPNRIIQLVSNKESGIQITADQRIHAMIAQDDKGRLLEATYDLINSLM